MAKIVGVQYSGTPTGTILPCGQSGALPMTLLCDGAAVSRTTYANLFAVIGTTYGSGDGSTTFNVPNTQGIFLRGAGSQVISSITYTGTRGTRQNDRYASHDHGGGSHTHQPVGGAGNYFIQNGGGDSGTFNWVGGGPTFQRGSVTATSGSIISASGSGTETNPANLGVNYCIAY